MDDCSTKKTICKIVFTQEDLRSETEELFKRKSNILQRNEKE